MMYQLHKLWKIILNKLCYQYINRTIAVVLKVACLFVWEVKNKSLRKICSLTTR